MFCGVNAEGDQSVFQAKCADAFVKHADRFKPVHTPVASNGNRECGELRAQWSSTIYRPWLGSTGCLFQFPVCNNGAYLVVADAAEYEPRSFEVLRTDKEVQICEFPLCNMAVGHERYCGTLENGNAPYPPLQNCG